MYEEEIEAIRALRRKEKKRDKRRAKKTKQLLAEVACSYASDAISNQGDSCEADEEEDEQTDALQEIKCDEDTRGQVYDFNSACAEDSDHERRCNDLDLFSEDDEIPGLAHSLSDMFEDRLIPPDALRLVTDQFFSVNVRDACTLR